MDTSDHDEIVINDIARELRSILGKYQHSHALKGGRAAANIHRNMGWALAAVLGEHIGKTCSHKEHRELKFDQLFGIAEDQAELSAHETYGPATSAMEH